MVQRVLDYFHAIRTRKKTLIINAGMAAIMLALLFFYIEL